MAQMDEAFESEINRLVEAKKLLLNASYFIAEEIPARVAADTAYQNAMKNSDKQNARIEHDNALQRVILDLLSDHTELFKQFSDNQSFKKWLSDTIFAATYETGSEHASRPAASE